MLSRGTSRAGGGFTLIEIFLVVAIIGILAAVAIPAFMKNARKAKTSEATINVKKIYDGARTYYEEELSARGSAGTPIAKQFPKTARGGVAGTDAGRVLRDGFQEVLAQPGPVDRQHLAGAQVLDG